MSPVDRAGPCSYWDEFSPGVHMRNFGLVSEMRKGQRSWGQAHTPNSRTKELKHGESQKS